VRAGGLQLAHERLRRLAALLAASYHDRVPTFDRITFDPAMMGGRACIRGMRLPVSVVVEQVAHGARVEEILADFPDLEEPDIWQALQYAAWLTKEEVLPARIPA
jgi:uncharacterized protein (DUF433 family)